MERKTWNRWFIVVLLLGTLVGVLASPAEQVAHAAVCCENCELFYQGCLEGTFYPSCGGDPTCCGIQTDSCFRSCVYC